MEITRSNFCNEYWKNAIDKAKVGSSLSWSNFGIHSNEDGYYSIELNQELLESINSLCKNNQLVVFTLLSCVFTVSVSKYLMAEDITVGIPCYRTEIQRVPLFSKVFPLSMRIDSKQIFKKYMMDVKDEILLIYKNQNCLNAKLLNDNDVKSILDLTPINICMNGLHKQEDIDYVINNKYQLLILIDLLKDKINEIKFYYDNQCLSNADIVVFGNLFINILKEVLENINIPIKEIALTSPDERNHILYDFNDNYLDIPSKITIPAIFEEQVNDTPNDLAVVFEDEKLTYRELNEKANSVARILREKGAAPKKIVGIIVDRSVDMVICVMGIIKSGAAYTPIDPDYPKERVRYILENSNADIIITKKEYAEVFEINCEIIDIEDETIYQRENTDLDITTKPEDLLYVLYTSGTTGNPKGVMVTQKNLINMIYSWRHHYQLEKFQVNLLQMASISFDVFSGDLSRSVLSGGCMYICPTNTRVDVKALYKLIEEKKISIFESTPSLIFVFMDYVMDNNLSLDNLKLLILGSDNCPINEYKRLLEKYGNRIRIINSYGVTETTIDSSYYEEKVENIPQYLINTPIGKPMHNTEFYVLGKSGEVQPVGVVGELYIGGAGVTLGYINRPELTEERFVSNPFKPGTKMYKTGDLARWLTDKNMEFIGRMDNQVKVRGFRIELGEIENKLLQHDNIKEAVVTAKEWENQKCICAYVSSNTDMKNLDLKSYLKSCLPNYMVPSYIVQLDKLPLTPNGKVDRKALPNPDFEDKEMEYIAPENEIEKKLIKIWEHILGVEKISIYDSFFDLGGHSLKAMVMVDHISKDLSVELPIKEIFRLETVKNLAEYISGLNSVISEDIPKVDESEYYSVSSIQKRMYILQKLNENSIAYNMPVIFKIDGKFNISRIEDIFKKLIERHETLRTCFCEYEGKIVQKVYKYEDNTFSIEQLNVKKFESLNALIEEFIYPFILEKAPLIRIGIINQDKNNYMLIDMHHIICDGVSHSILAQEFVELYLGRKLKELKIQYRDYAAWQLAFNNSEEYKKQEAYWLKEFEGELPVLNLPTDFTRRKEKNFKGNSVSFALDKAVTNHLRKLVKSHGSTLFMILMANIGILFAKISGQEDIIIGSPIAGRNHKDLENIIGMFVNTLAFRMKVDTDLKFCDYLENVKNKALLAYNNQNYQFDDLVEKVGIDKSCNRNPLFDIMFVFQNKEKSIIETDDISCKPCEVDSKTEKFDMTINAEEDEDEIRFTLSYASSLFKEETIKRIGIYLNRIIKQTIQNNKIYIKDIDLLSENEKVVLLKDFNNTKSEYPHNKVLHEVFQEQVARTPNKIAVAFDDEFLTYRELDQKSNAFARVLRNKGVKPNDIIGITSERSVKVIVGILAILKSGGAYMPLDMEYPKQRIQYMIHDSHMKIILNSGKADFYHDEQCEILNLCDETVYAEDCSGIDKVNKSEDLAYIMYTSGTTGEPKGVKVIHRNVMRLVINTNYIQITKSDNILQTGSIAFDASTFEIWGALLNGATLFLTHKEVILNTELFKKVLQKNKITIIWLTSSLFSKLVSDDPQVFNGVEYLLSGGDVVSSKHVKMVKENDPHLHLINGYGPTENTTFSTFYEVKEITDNLPIGKPIANSTAYIFDTYQKLVPIGVPGELYVGGDGISMGYLGNKEFTKAKFMLNPYNENEVVYKTGDLVRWLYDGNIEFMGRMDHQVKIRGFRVELDEIAKKLSEINDIKEAIVIVRGEDEYKFLCGYYVSGKDFKPSELRKILSNSLPGYMIPSFFIRLDELPLTTNGKVDRDALPEIDENIESGEEYVKPNSEIEKVVTDIFASILMIEKVGITNDFFEIGGNSLSATKLTGRIHQRLNVNVPLSEIFKLRNAKHIAEYISHAKEDNFISIETVKPAEYYDVSSAQKRMFVFQKMNILSTTYNIPLAVEIKGKLDLGKVRSVFNELIERHESLRTSFHLVNSRIVQKVHSIEEVSFDIQLSMFTDDIDDSCINDEIVSFAHPFNLEQFPLFKVKVMHMGEERFFIIFDIHHIITDGTSMSIMINEFSRLYNGQILDELGIQYKDYAEWQKKKRETEVFKHQEKYWCQEFSGQLPALSLVKADKRNNCMTFNGDSIEFFLEKSLTNEVIHLAKETKTTLFMVLLANINVLLSKYTGQDEIIVGTPIAGRNHHDLDNIVGMFVNTLAIRSKVIDNISFYDYLSLVKEKTLHAFANQDYQFEELVDKIGAARSINRNPIFDVMFVFQNFDEIELTLGDAVILPYDVKTITSTDKFDMTIEARMCKDKIQFKISYLTELFNKQSMLRISELLHDLIKITCMEGRTKKLKDFELMTEEEKKSLNDKMSIYDSCNFTFSF